MPGRKSIPIPEAVAGLQINFCKNTQCSNYGIPPEGTEVASRYKLVLDHQRHALLCKACNRITILKSNASVADELSRFQYQFPRKAALCCPNEQCSNHFLDISEHPGQYYKFGTTSSGQPRFRCKQCLKTFSRKKTRRLQRRPELNERIYLALVNKIPINRICEIESVQPKTVYDKLDFLYERCQQFSALHEHTLQQKEIPSFYLATDTRNFHLNWQSSSQRKNVCLQTVTTTDISSGYVLACHSNINPARDLKTVERELRESGQMELPKAFRHYAHILLTSDYGTGRKSVEPASHDSLLEAVQQKYLEMSCRQDFGVAEVLNRYTSPPVRGVQVRFDYTLYGHFAWLKTILPEKCHKVFYLAFDSGIREACLSLFSNQFLNNQTNAFYVRTESELSIATKRQRLREANEVLREYQQRFPELDTRGAELAIIRDRMSTMPAIGHWGDRWLLHPRPHMGEPGKVVSHTCDTGRTSLDRLTDYYRKASLYSSKLFYKQLQNRISVVPEQNETGPSGHWNLYGAYKPSVVIKLIEIFRTYNNFVLTDKYGQTPAQRLGLASEVLAIKDIIAEQQDL